MTDRKSFSRTPAFEPDRLRVMNQLAELVPFAIKLLVVSCIWLLTVKFTFVVITPDCREAVVLSHNTNSLLELTVS